MSRPVTHPLRVGKTWRSVAGAVLLGISLSAAGGDGWSLEAGSFSAVLGGTVSIGAAWRTEAPDPDLLGKLNVPGQQTLCAADDCMSLTGDLEPNQRLVDARGAFSGTNADNGNLNYAQYDLVAATARISPELTLAWGPALARFSGIAYYDPANVSFDETHTNTLYQPAQTRRPSDIERRYAQGYKWREAYVATELPFGAVPWVLSVGNQVVRWGESNLTLFNTLNEVSPADATVARIPGFTVSDAYQAIPAVVLSGVINDAWSFEALWQLRWRGAEVDPAGSFMSISDVAGGGEYVMSGLGQFSEDPDRQYTPAGLAGMITSSTRTLYVLPEATGEPKDSGQFGLQLKYFAEGLNQGTEFGAYYLRYHSRVPYLSAYAADASCTRSSRTNSFLEVLAVCRGFNGSINPLGGLEPLPIETAKPFLDYPEGIDLFGLSVNSSFGGWSIYGEYAYRPNMPLPVHFTDVLFAALAPAFPAEDIEVPLDLGALALFTLPAYSRALPSFLAPYRGIEQYAAGERVTGYERFKVGQLTLGGIRSFGPGNLLGADQITVLLEAGLTHIVDLPALSELQIEGHGDRTHYGPGVDGTGDPNGQPDSLRINPTQQTRGFATDWSAGYRLLLRATYSRIVGDVSLHPTLLWFHDVHGVSPAVMDNYVEGRITAVLLLDADLTQDFSAGVQYQIYAGADALNLRQDRDNVSVNLRYAF